MDKILEMKHVPATQCGIWVRTSNGGHFASPNYPDSYPPNKECIYILEGIWPVSMFHWMNVNFFVKLNNWLNVFLNQFEQNLNMYFSKSNLIDIS